MTVNIKNYVDRFEPLDGSPIWTFPLESYEYESSQSTRSPVMTAIGADYGLRLRGTKKALRDVGTEHVRCVYVGTSANMLDQDIKWDAARLLIGQWGKLWLTRADGTRRWRWAELADLPDIQISWDKNGWLPMAFTFKTFGDWNQEVVVSQSQTITSSGQAWVVNNPGNLPATRMTIRIRANNTTAFTSPEIRNITNGYTWQHGRTASTANQEIKLDTRQPAVYWSTDDGANYTSDFGNYVLAALPVTQKILTYRLEPGNNTLNGFSATPNYNVDIEFDAPMA